MNVRCPGCGKTYRVPPERLAGKAPPRLKCPACQTVFVARDASAQPTPAAKPGPAPAPDRPSRASAPSADTTQALKRAGDGLSSTGKLRAGSLTLPEGKKISLAILTGPDQGTIVQVPRPRMVIGRAGADLVLSDPEVSRQHAVVEAYEDRFLLRDLSSTNGTFVGDQKITAQELENHSEFRVGMSRIMLIVTADDE